MTSIQALWEDLLAMTYPICCAACDTALERGESILCTHCRLTLPMTDHLRRPADNPVVQKFWGKIPIEYAFAYLRYVRRGRTQRLLHRLKYEDQPEIGRLLGQLLGLELRRAGLEGCWDAVVPVPLHPKKLRERGYNQAEVFGAGIAQMLHIPLCGQALERVAYNVSQTTMNRQERRRNVQEIFGLARPEEVAGRRILLVDDVITTGATIEVCAMRITEGQAAGLGIAAIASGARV